MIRLAETLLVALWILLPVGCLIAWTVALVQRRRGIPWLPFSPRRAVPWGLIDLLGILAVLVLMRSASWWWLAQSYGLPPQARLADLSPDEKIRGLVASSLASLATLALAIVMVRWRTGADRGDFGIDPGRFSYDLMLGSTGFVMLVVPVFAIQYVLTKLWMETAHPLVQLVREHPNTWYFLLSSVAAVVVAPLAEEFLFRVFLQGWLEKVAYAMRAGPHGEADRSERTAELLVGSPSKGDDGFGAERPGSMPTTENPYEPPPATDSPLETDSDHGPEQDASNAATAATVLVAPAHWPIVLSAALFALAHYEHGPDPVALFLLALGIGYIYQRTHRVVPCIVVHFLVNAVSMLQLWVLAGSPDRVTG
jgi:membrane protease YdiL (CAAX protease family)